MRPHYRLIVSTDDAGGANGVIERRDGWVVTHYPIDDPLDAIGNYYFAVRTMRRDNPDMTAAQANEVVLGRRYDAGVTRS